MTTQDERIAELTEAAGQIVESINQLNRETGGQLITLATRAKRSRMMIWALSVSMIFDLLLTGFVVSLATQVDRTQQLTRSQVLCPLYQQFVNADTPAARQLAAKNGQDIAARDVAFRVIHQSYDTLDCADIKPKGGR